MRADLLILLIFAVAVFAVLYAPIPFVEAGQIPAARGLAAPLLGVAFLIAYFVAPARSRRK